MKRIIVTNHLIHIDFSKTGTVIYKGSYRDKKLGILYRMVVSLIPAEDSRQDAIQAEMMTYDNIQVVLQPVNSKECQLCHSQPKRKELLVFSYDAAEIMPESGGEWMSNNFNELSHEVKRRLTMNILSGEIEKDFESKTCVLRTGVADKNSNITDQIEFFEINESGQVQKANR